MNNTNFVYYLKYPDEKSSVSAPAERLHFLTILSDTRTKKKNHQQTTINEEDYDGRFVDTYVSVGDMKPKEGITTVLP